MRTTHLAIVRINLVKPGETRSSPDLKKKRKTRRRREVRGKPKRCRVDGRKRAAETASPPLKWLTVN